MNVYVASGIFIDVRTDIFPYIAKVTNRNIKVTAKFPVGNPLGFDETSEVCF